MNITEIKAHDLATRDLMIERQEAERDARYAMDRIHDEAGDKRVNISKRYGYSDYRWSMSEAEAHVKVADLAADPRNNYAHASDDCNDNFYAYIGKKAQEKLDALREAVEESERLGDEIAAREAVFYANLWSRFEVVPGGHIHNRNSTCHTLRPTTRVAWIPTLSGDTEADAVAQYGPALCSHCFKSAPVEWQQKSKVQKDSEGNPLTLAEAQKIADEKAAAKAAREAKKAAREAKAGAR
jgi:hypothetical protein